MSDEKIDFGHAVSIEEAQLITPPGQEQQTKDASIDPNSDLWSYHHLKRIQGFPVAEGDLDLPIGKESTLDDAFYLKRTPRSKIFWMSPEDEESIALYDGLLALQADHQIQIIDELKQYDTSKCKFMVWIRYDETCFALNPRFDFLREELHDE